MRVGIISARGVPITAFLHADDTDNDPEEVREQYARDKGWAVEELRYTSVSLVEPPFETGLLGPTHVIYDKDERESVFYKHFNAVGSVALFVHGDFGFYIPEHSYGNEGQEVHRITEHSLEIWRREDFFKVLMGRNLIGF